MTLIVEDGTIADILISCDGTWQKRGYTSLYGVAFVIGFETGKVLDYHVMSKHCPGCRQWEAKDQTTADYMEWKESHKCKQNYFGSSGGMELEGAKTMFKQSLQDGVHFTLNHTDDSENVKVGVQLLGHLQILVLICLARTIRSWIGQSISTKLGSKFTSAPHNNKFIETQIVNSVHVLLGWLQQFFLFFILSTTYT